MPVYSIGLDSSILNDKSFSLGTGKIFSMAFPERGVLTGITVFNIPLNAISIQYNLKSYSFELNSFYGYHRTKAEVSTLRPRSYYDRTLWNTSFLVNKKLKRNFFILMGFGYAKVDDNYLDWSFPQSNIFVYTNDEYVQLRFEAGIGYEYAIYRNILYIESRVLASFPIASFHYTNYNPNVSTIISGYFGLRFAFLNH